MIKIKQIHIEEFRGIRNLDMNLAGKNFGICGPNGTGKSGVVDAIEFCLTGSVTRLTGQGQGELSVKSHSPHVDQRTKPENARVSIVANIPAIGKDVTIARAVSKPREVSISPSGEKAIAIVKELQFHPEFALSRREIAKYIITPPSQRSADVQNLLRLEHIGNLRKAFVSYANKCKREADDANREFEVAKRELQTALGLQSLDREKVLEKANEKRCVLGLPELTDLLEGTTILDSATNSGDSKKKGKITKDVAISDLAALASAIEAGEPEDSKQNRANALAALENLKEDSAALTLARRHGLITAGLDLVTENACPLCDTPWDAEALRQHLEAKLLSAKALSSLLEKLDEELNAHIGRIKRRAAAMEKVGSYASALQPPVAKGKIEDHVSALMQVQEALVSFQDNRSQIDAAVRALSTPWWEMPTDVGSQIDEVQKGISALPDDSARDKAIGFLTELQVRFRRLIAATKTKKGMNARHKVAQKLRDTYNEVSNSVLESIYDSVAQEFTEYYRAINDDEPQFFSELKAQPAKLSFNVDFYGRGVFPPGAYHSEGHQDGMGLCLYLALMKHTLGDKFTFAVLDDVMMSVDAGHRRAVCRLLKTEFPNTQFILTTHDRVWLQYMKTQGLISSSQFFGGWNVDTGPRIWDDTDVWAEIETALERDDMPRAAALMRRYLEYISAVLADNLRARVIYQADANYDLGDLMQPVLNRWKDRLKKSVKAAESWGDDETRAELAATLEEAENLVNRCNAEQGAINKLVHFNEWADFTKGEFQSVADAFRDLLDHIRCSNPICGAFPYVIPSKGASEQLRCDCGEIDINLKTK